ncbi:hypothetical protein BVY03_02265 [bacterium K02(2017)]|nr:hypothetical protein BVY03_02265 [bacterium K02(2017)]
MNTKIHLFFIPFITVLVTGYYTYFGQMVPQKEVHPPQKIAIGKDMPTDQMVEVGQKIYEGKGTCASCHKLQGGSGRFPDLGNIGSVAASREAGLSDIEYLSKSLYRPNDFILEGFSPGMPQINKAPIQLTDSEIKTVIAYLQSLGGTASITMGTKLKYEGESKPVEKTASSAPAKPKEPKELLQTYMCGSCHSLDQPIKLVGPSLYDIGKHLNKAQLYEALLDPDATVGEGYAKGMMGGTLKGIGFYKKVSTEEMQALVNYLAESKGK